MKKIRKCLLVLFIIIRIPAAFFAEENKPEYFEEAGTYPIVLKDEYGYETKTIYITVLFPRTVQDDGNQEAIDAYDLQIKGGEFSKLTDIQLIQLTNARAWDITNGKKVAIDKIERVIVDKKNGWYQVTFKTKKNTQTTVNILEINEETLVSNSTEKIYTNFFNLFRKNELALLVSLFVLIPIFILIAFYILSRKRVQEVQRLLYEK